MAGSFALDLSRFRIKTEEQMSRVVRKICLELFTLVVTRSPVDTGRFRANNQISLNSMTSDTVVEFRKTKAGLSVGFSRREIGSDGGTTVKQAPKLDAYALGDTVFIYNNVEYALEIEYGTSKQAPAGVYRISVQDLVNHFDSLVRSAR